ncbi:MAG: diacylglycerol kinase [Pseudomonadota bacterium]
MPPRAGLKTAFEKEAAFRQELVVFALLLPAAFWLGNSALERAALIGSCLLVLIVELLNSAVEAVVDRFGGAMHRLSGSAKDMGSAAVLLSILNVVVVWGLIVGERLAV